MEEIVSSTLNKTITSELTQLASETATTALFRWLQIPRVLKGLQAKPSSSLSCMHA
jgi:hypothetical protein